MSFPSLSRVIHPSFTGHTAGVLPGRYVASFHGGITVPASHLIGGTAQSHWRYDQAVAGVERLTREHERTYCNSVSAGLWLNDGVYYFDVSTSFHDVEDALKFARDNDQLAIFDTVTNKEIPVPACV